MTEAARREWELFSRRYEELLKKVREEVSLTILVWGPNPDANTPVARKRRDIRDHLRKAGHNAMFSEDIPLVRLPGARLSEKSKEYAQARAADFIVILLEDSPGALGEVHDFAEDRDVVHKIRVLLPKRYKRGYSGRGLIGDLEQGWGCVEWYEPRDLKQCNVLSSVLWAAEARRQVSYRTRSSRGNP